MIFGCTGFVGKELTKLLLSNNIYNLYLVSRNFEKYKIYKQQKNCNLVFYDNIRRLTHKVTIDIIIHLASEINNLNKVVKVNVDITRLVLETAKYFKVKKIIYVSSISIYSKYGSLRLINEHSNKNPISNYGRSKLYSQKLIIDQCKINNIDYVNLIPTNIINTDKLKPYFLLNFIKSIRYNRFIYFGKGPYWLNYISTENVIEAINYMVANQEIKNEDFILNTPIKVNESVNIISEELDIDAPKLSIPYFLGSAVFTMTDFFLEKSKLTNDFLMKSKFFELTNPTYVSGDHIVQSSKFKYSISIEKSLKLLVEVYKKMNLI